MGNWPGLLVLMGTMAGCLPVEHSSAMYPDLAPPALPSSKKETGTEATPGAADSQSKPSSRPETTEASPWPVTSLHPPQQELLEPHAPPTGLPSDAVTAEGDVLAPLPSVHMLTRALRAEEMEKSDLATPAPALPAETGGEGEKITLANALAQTVPEVREDVRPHEAAGSPQKLAPVGHPVLADAPATPGSSLPPGAAAPKSDKVQDDAIPAAACQYRKEPTALPEVAPTGQEPAGAAVTPPDRPCARFVGSIETEAGGAAREAKAATAPAALPPPTAHVDQQTQARKVEVPAEPVGVTVEGSQGAGAVLRLVNSKGFSLAFEIQDAGPSGVAGVDLWYTQDGQNWRKYDATPRHQSPYIIEVPEEDFYGFTLVAHNGVGRGKQPPQPGDLPQVWVGVDVTKPLVRLLGVQAGTGPQAGTLTILWTASDKNLVAQPITISYATKSGGPWLPIAAGLKNMGSYVWRMPPDTPSCVLIRVEAVDLVGNVGVAQTPDPLLGDRSQPNVSIVNVVPLAQ